MNLIISNRNQVTESIIRQRVYGTIRSNKRHPNLCSNKVIKKFQIFHFKYGVAGGSGPAALSPSALHRQCEGMQLSNWNKYGVHRSLWILSFQGDYNLYPLTVIIIVFWIAHLKKNENYITCKMIKRCNVWYTQCR